MMRSWVVRATVTIDGLDKPERTVRVEAARPVVALRAGVVAVLKLWGCPPRSGRLTELTATVRALT